MVDISYQLKQMQLQKTIGELKALLACYYDPMQGLTKEFEESRRIILDMVNELENNFG